MTLWGVAGLSDRQIDLLREFREVSGRSYSIASSTFLEFIAPEASPKEHELIEFL